MLKTGSVNRRSLLRVAGALSLGMAAPSLILPTSAAAAGTFPSQPVEVLIGSSAGGGTDRSVRLIGTPLGPKKWVASSR